MNRFLPLLLLTLPLFSACQSGAPRPAGPQLPAQQTGYSPKHKTYAEARAFAESEKAVLKKELQAAGGEGRKAVLAKAQIRFTRLMNETLIPHWYGTTWDFNGTSQQPGEGEIACGYFVTTLLRDAGFPLNRVKLAQCASGKIIHALVAPSNSQMLGHLTFEGFIEKVKSYGEGLYLIGLDSHTGFLLHDGKELYFVHSNYINRQGVVKEVAALSPALRSSKFRQVGRLTKDEGFITRWLGGA